MTLDTVQGTFVYRDKKAQSERVTLQSLDVAPANAWGLRCKEDRHWTERKPIDLSTDKYHRHRFNCPQGHDQDSWDVGLALVEEDTPLVTNPSDILAREWWHISENEALTIDPGRLMHVGSRDAAIHRALLLQHRSSMHLYKVTLKLQSLIETEILLEYAPGESLEKVFSIQSSPEPKITRYVNGQEAPGSISLIIAPSAIEGISLEDSYPQSW